VNKFYRVRGGSLIEGSTANPTIVDRALPWSPEDAGINLWNASEKTLAPGSNFIAGSEFSGSRDWVLHLGTMTKNTTIDCGGKFVYIPKFEANITFDPTTDYSKAITGRRALLIQNFAGVHLETFRLYGTTISDGLNLSTTVAGAIAQVQHFRIEGLRENYYDTGSGVALIDAAQAQFNHPDVIQSYGGPAVLRVSNFYASSDRSFHTIATAGGPIGPPLQEVTIRRGHYKQLTHPVLGNQQTYPFFWNQAAGDPATFPGTYRQVYYEHGSGARNAAAAFFPNGDPGYEANVSAGGIIEAAAPVSAFWVPAVGDVGVGGTTPAYA
jgi:hypothetical protein